MLGLTRYNPLRELADVQATMNRFFGETFDRFFDDRGREILGSWNPLVDIYENDEEVVFSAELPGFEKEDINISVADGRLTISGQRKHTAEQKKGTYHQVERWYGSFNRTFLLPASVDYNHIRATLKNGVLTFSVPKKEEAKPKQISVSVQ